MYGIAMAELEIELGGDLIEEVKRLAVGHYGDGGDASMARAVEAAFRMRLLWLDLVEGGGSEVEEPTVNWEFEDTSAREKAPAEIQDWLFRRR